MDEFLWFIEVAHGYLLPYINKEELINLTDKESNTWSLNIIFKCEIKYN